MMRIAPSLLAAAAVALGTTGLPGRAAGAIIYSENFNALTGIARGDVPTSQREPGTYFDITNLATTGFTATGQVLGFNLDGPNRALLLNEGTVGSTADVNQISRTITGLTPGTMYTLTFDYFGDNVPGPYSFEYEINGTTTAVAAVNPGLNGTFNTVSFAFTAAGASTTLRFRETVANGSSSPIFDNIVISDNAAAEVPEPGTLAVFGALALGGMAMRRRKS